MKKLLLWLWPKIRWIYGRYGIEVSLGTTLTVPAPMKTQASGAHAAHVARSWVPGAHVWMLVLLLAGSAQAAPRPEGIAAVHNAFRGYANPFRMGEPLASYDPQGGGSTSGPAFRFDGSYNLLVNCITGCSASSGFTDNSAFTVGTSTINPLGGYYSTLTPAISSGNAGRVRMDANSYLYVDCITGCSASAGFSDNSAFTAETTPIGISGGWYSTSPTNCTSGNACAPQLTVDRKLFVQDFQGTSPWVVSANGGSFAVTQSGTWTVQQGGAPWSMAGTLTRNNAAPGSNNLGVLPCLVNTSAPSPTSGDIDFLSCDTSGNIRVVIPGTVAVTGTFWQATQPVSATSLPLPTGAATSANQCGATVGSPCSTGGNGSGNLTGQIMCDSTVIKNALASSGMTLLVAAPGTGKNTYICGFTVNGASATLNTVKLVYGTHTTTDCDTGANDLSVAVPIQAPSSVAPAGQNVSPPSNVLWKTGVTNNQVCVNLSAAQAVNLQVLYTSF